ncbi:MAG: Holliday junction resolvase RuvX [Actinomycetaceae bacterium]|nr:Holliday junction resolvase RuvX [Actinomycetaceae bacterium]
MKSGVRIAFDYGTRRIGVAKCDPEGILCTPLCTIAADKYGVDIDQAADIVEDESAVHVYVGNPLLLSGNVGRSSSLARKWARELARKVAVPVTLVDERLTSVSAHSRLTQAGLSQKRHRSIVDQEAAVIILEEALKKERAKANTEETNK